jgi:hypothetical protein
MTAHIRAEPFERTEARTGHRNGYQATAHCAGQSDGRVTGKRFVDIRERRQWQTEIRVTPGGLVWDRLINSVGIARKVRKVLETAVELGGSQ